MVAQVETMLAAVLHTLLMFVYLYMFEVWVMNPLAAQLLQHKQSKLTARCPKHDARSPVCLAVAGRREQGMGYLLVVPVGLRVRIWQ